MKELTQENINQLRDAIRRTDEDLERRRADPKVQERAKFYRMWLAIGTYLSLEDEVFCPVCGWDKSPGSTHLVFKCHPENKLSDVMDILQHALEEGSNYGQDYISIEGYENPESKLLEEQ